MNRLSDYPQLLVSYMAQAFSTAKCAKARRRKTGAIVLRNLGGSYFQPISGGYNGTRTGTNNRCEDIQGITFPGVLHAERNCLTKMQQEGISSRNTIVVVTFIPCPDCVERMIDAQVAEVYYCEERTEPERTKLSIERMRKHGIWVKQVGKEEVSQHLQDVLFGLDQEKFCGEQTELPWQEFYSTISHMVDSDKAQVLYQMEMIADDLKLFANETLPMRIQRSPGDRDNLTNFDKRLVQAMNTIWDMEWEIYKQFMSSRGIPTNSAFGTSPDAFEDLFGFYLLQDGISQDCQQIWERYSKVNLNGKQS